MIYLSEMAGLTLCVVLLTSLFTSVVSDRSDRPLVGRTPVNALDQPSLPGQRDGAQHEPELEQALIKLKDSLMLISGSSTDEQEKKESNGQSNLITSSKASTQNEAQFVDGRNKTFFHTGNKTGSVRKTSNVDTTSNEQNISSQTKNNSYTSTPTTVNSAVISGHVIGVTTQQFDENKTTDSNSLIPTRTVSAISNNSTESLVTATPSSLQGNYSTNSASNTTSQGNSASPGNSTSLNNSTPSINPTVTSLDVSHTTSKPTTTTTQLLMTSHPTQSSVTSSGYQLLSTTLSVVSSTRQWSAPGHSGTWTVGLIVVLVLGLSAFVVALYYLASSATSDSRRGGRATTVT